MPDQPKRYICRHIHASGLRCGSPCLRGEHFCYYHHASRRPVQLRPRPTQENFIPHDAAFLLPSLEDRPAIQLAISEVVSQIAANQIDHGRARLLLYALRTASMNLPPHPRPARPKPESDRYDGTYETGETGDSRDYTTSTDEPLDSTIDLTTPIEEVDHDPTLGPLAPIAELLPPEEEEPGITPFERYLEDMRRARPACPQCNPAPNPDSSSETPPRTIQATADSPELALQAAAIIPRIQATADHFKVAFVHEMGLGFSPDTRGSAQDVGFSPRDMFSYPVHDSFPDAKKQLTMTSHIALKPGA